MRKLCVLTVLALTLGLGVAAKEESNASSDVIKARGGLSNFCKSLLEFSKGKDWREKRMKVAYYGNEFIYNKKAAFRRPIKFRPSAAAGKKNSFCHLMTLFLARELVPKSVLFTSNIVTDAPSWYGAFKISRNVIRPFGDIPFKLAVLDFSSNDMNMPRETVLSGMEGMVRQIRKKFPETDIVFLYSPNKEILKIYQNGKIPDSIAWQEELADHYQIPSVNIAKLVADKIASGEMKEDSLLCNSLLNDEGDKLCLETIKPMFEKGLAEAKKMDAPRKLEIPKPLGKCPIDKPERVSYDKAELQPGWLGWQKSPLDSCLHVLQCDKSGPVVTLKFKGDVAGMLTVVGPDSGNLESSLDGGEWKLIKLFDEKFGEKYKTQSVLLAEGVDPSKTHSVKLRVAAETPKGSKGKTARIDYFYVNGKPVYDNPYKGMNSLQVINTIYKGMEPVKYVPYESRWQHLTKTMKKLNDGPALNMVMLGDSIVNDTAYSKYELLLGKMYPKCKIKKIVSVRGSTGCWWYKDDNRVQEYVLKHNPDVVIIGGISNRGDTDAIQSVIKQVKAAKPDTEFLLLTGTFGANQDPKLIKDWQRNVKTDGKCYRSRLKKLAQDENVEFLDMRGIWGEYILNSKWTCGSFMRDPVHANDRGKQILGRILEKYFAPKK